MKTFHDGHRLTVIAAVLLAICLGHQGHRILQLAALALPGLLCLWWHPSGNALRRLRAAIIAVWTAGFVLDGVLRYYLRAAYEAAPESSLILSAVANTHPQEVREFLTMYGLEIALCLSFAMLGIGLGLHAAVCSLRPDGRPAPNSKQDSWRTQRRAATAVLVLLCLAAYINKPTRRWHPALFWPTWALKIDDLRYSWAHQEQRHAESLAEARAVTPVRTDPSPSTVVMVLSDSVNRDNMQLYGYARATTPELQRRKQGLSDELLVLRDAWSSEAGTYLALGSIFEFGAAQDPASLHLLALARAAGYEVWWISNHDDLAIAQVHGQLADQVRFVNRVPGRVTASLDEAVMPALHEALADSSRDKFIVVHMLGAHPHYALRYPSGDTPFDDAPDSVDQAMIAQQRPWWLRQKRAEYDAAILYHDGVVSRTLDETRKHQDPGEYSAWIYLSDHGQEVGHEIDRAGHSAQTSAGYRIPTLIWQSQPRQPLPADVAERPFRSDWSAWTLANLMGIDWQKESSAKDVLHSEYRWQRSQLPERVRP